MATQTKSGRIFATSSTFSGGAVTATTLYFNDGTKLVLEGALNIPVPVTLELVYDEDAKKGAKLLDLTLLGGAVT